MSINPDHVLIKTFLEHPDKPVPFNSCELAVMLGAQIVRVDPAASTLELSYEPPQSFAQGMGVLQGGIVTAMLDFAMALSTMARLPLNRSCATVSMNVNFLRAARLTRYRTVAVADRVGKSLAFAHARLLMEENNELVATASSTLALADCG